MMWLVALALAGEPRMLTLEDALAGAAEANPAVVRTQLAATQAEADVRAAWGGFDPTLSLNGGWNTSSNLSFLPFLPTPLQSSQSGWNLATTLQATAPTGTGVRLTGEIDGSHQQGDSFQGPFERRTLSGTGSIGLSQELLRGVRLGYNLQRVRRAREGLSLAELELEKVRAETRAATARAYWTWVQQVRLAEIASVSVAVAEEALRVGAAKVEAGELAPLERTRLEAALVQARTTSLDASHAARQSADALLVLMGEASGAELAPGSAVGEPSLLTLDDAAVAETAASQNLDVAIARARVDAARLALADAKHTMWPSLQATVDGGVTANRVTEVGEDPTRGNFPQFAVGGTFSMPLGNRAALGQLQRAGSELALQETALAEAERQLRADVDQQLRVLRSARQKVELADANVRLADETLRAEEALAAAGRAILKDVLEARDGLDKARAEAVRARVEVRLAEVELERLTGG
ncbi:MAG TPA: TolC family protein [Myxococcota bacterium]|nr:TolC family protein [Myxococcota bacterium]